MLNLGIFHVSLSVMQPTASGLWWWRHIRQNMRVERWLVGKKPLSEKQPLAKTRKCKWRFFIEFFFIETPPWSDAKCYRQMSWRLIWRKVSASTRPVCEFYLVIIASPIVNSDFRKVSKAYRKMEATEGVLIAMITILWYLPFNKLHHGEIVRYYIVFSNKGGLKKSE